MNNKNDMLSDKEYEKYDKGNKNSNQLKNIQSIKIKKAIESKELICTTNPKGIFYITAN
ncbi:MAG: hypothetical protein V8S33_07045 [Intestinibacter bartlettii]